MAKTLGLHILADIYGIDPDRIDRVEDIKDLLETSCTSGRITHLNSHMARTRYSNR